MKMKRFLSIKETAKSFRGAKLHDALCLQSAMQKIPEAVKELIAIGKVLALKKGIILIKEGTYLTDIYFILCGTVEVSIHNSFTVDRSENNHVGEMALIDPTIPRGATVKARKDAVVFKVSRDKFLKLANKYPAIWQNISRELSNRLRQRNKHIRIKNKKIHMFIGSSSEQLKRADSMNRFFNAKKMQCLPWNTLFNPGSITIDKLLETIEKADFAVLIISKDDVTESRGKKAQSPRDNVLLELGLFMGRLGRERTFLVHEEDAKIPSDLLGLTRISFSDNRSFRHACKPIEQQILKLGYF
jgi:predicted nucleotide-binding protein